MPFPEGRGRHPLLTTAATPLSLLALAAVVCTATWLHPDSGRRLRSVLLSERSVSPLATPSTAAEQPPPTAASTEASAFETALRGCRDLRCIQHAHTLPKKPGQFNFPHFHVLGYSKCATTSLYVHLVKHPAVLGSTPKEPCFYTFRCSNTTLACPAEEQEKYITETLNVGQATADRLQRAAFDGSAHYAVHADWLAPQLAALMPWLKLVFSMREPISQAISMRLHYMIHGTVDPRFFRQKDECYNQHHERIFHCADAWLDTLSRYALSLRPWLENFPPAQLHFIQYENLTSANTAAVLWDMKQFIGVDPDLPSDQVQLEHANDHRKKPDPRNKDEKKLKQAEGWRMLRREYLQLVKKARRNAQEVVEIVAAHADAQAWMANWEAVWQNNLQDHCAEEMEGECLIQTN